MEIINPRYSVLTNLEVYETLKNIKDTKKKYGLRNLATITYETLQFLEDTACKNQTSEEVLQFLREIKKYKFTKNESLMMVNEPPTTGLDIQLLIEDSEERLTEDQMSEVLQLVSTFLVVDEES